MAEAAHVLVFPMPAQGHLNCMLHFATGLLQAGLHVTFLHTEHNLRRLGGAAAAAASSSPRIRFLSVPDGLPDDHPRLVDSIPELLESLWTWTSSSYRALLSSPLCRGRSPDDGFPPVTCVVADGVLPFAIDVAEELGVPAIPFRTVSACAVLAYLSIPGLIDLGELPFPDGSGADLDAPVRGVPGMEGFVRRRDLPVQCRHLTSRETHDEPLLKTVVPATLCHARARALLLNTSASLEAPSLAHLKRTVRDVFAVGPLHSMSPDPAAATSLWRQDDGTAAWLDARADRSVVYVCLGSLAVLSRAQSAEFLAGLVAAGYAFLWVLRPGSVDAALRDAVAAVGEARARVVPWVAQRDVLRHRAVGCFLTHSGWNSTLEGLAAGVPMVCWPFFADQQVNSRFVDAVWKVGLDMKDVSDRSVVERMVREAMESAEIRAAAQGLARQLRRDVADGGASAVEFERLVTFIRELGASSKHGDVKGT